MKKITNIDDLFKEGAAGFKMDPSAGLFDKIAALHLKKKRRKRMAVYYWSLAALLLVLIGISGWFFLNTEQIEGVDEQEQIVTQIDLKEALENETKEKLEESPDKNVGQNMILSAQVETDKKNLLSDEPLGLNEDDLEGAIWVSKTKPDLLIEENVEYTFTNNPSFEVSKYVVIEEMTNRSIYEIAQTNPNPIDPRTVPGMEKYLEKRNNLHFYTGIGATIAMAYYPDTEDQFTWSADMALGLKIQKFYIESGVGYQQMNERGIYQIDFRSNDSIGYFNEVISFEVDPQNPEEITFKTKETTVYDSVDHYTHTTPLFEYSYVNIPIKIGYRFYEKERLSIAAETGVIFSWMLSKKIPDVSLNNPDYELLAITNKTPERVEINYQWQLSVRLNYRFAKSMSVAAQPVFTKYINSIYDTKSGYSNVKPYTMGIRFGVYFDF